MRGYSDLDLDVDKWVRVGRLRASSRLDRMDPSSDSWTTRSRPCRFGEIR